MTTSADHGAEEGLGLISNESGAPAQSTGTTTNPSPGPSKSSPDMSLPGPGNDDSSDSGLTPKLGQDTAFRPPPEGERWEDDAPQASASTAQTNDGAEIQSIMDQFAHETDTGDRSGVEHFPPPRSSSLDSTAPKEQYALHKTESGSSRREALGAQLTPTKSRTSLGPGSSASSIFQPPPPSPTSSEPETDLPFDFHRFLEQLRHRTADPVARFLRSFLVEFGKRQWMVHEQVKIISDFLDFICKKMSQCEVWRTLSDAEFDNAREGMEKLVMNRLYSQTFSPAIPPPDPSTPSKRRRPQPQASKTTGRKGQHQEDVERDQVIAQKMGIYGWIQPEHLDVPGIKDKGRSFLRLAQQELLKINSYRAPRDKIICVLNCCKVIFGFLKSNASDQSADAFIPLLILTVLHAKPDHLVSNVQYILRFRNQDKLAGETSYYISSLSGVLTFIENVDRTNLVITDAEFEAHVEAAVKGITEGHKPGETISKTPPTHLSEKSTISRPEVTPRNSMDAVRISPRKKGSDSGSADSPENVASGLLRTFQKPLSTIGRIFSDDSTRLIAGRNPRSQVPVAVGDKAIEADVETDTGVAEAQRTRVEEHRIVVE